MTSIVTWLGSTKQSFKADPGHTFNLDFKYSPEQNHIYYRTMKSLFGLLIRKSPQRWRTW